MICQDGCFDALIEWPSKTPIAHTLIREFRMKTTMTFAALLKPETWRAVPPVYSSRLILLPFFPAVALASVGWYGSRFPYLEDVSLPFILPA